MYQNGRKGANLDLDKWPLERCKLISTISGKVRAKIEKQLLTNF